VILLPSRLLQYPASVADYDCVGRDNDGGLAALFVVDFAFVHLHRFGFGGLEDIGCGSQLMRIVLGECRRADVDFGQSDLVGMSIRLVRAGFMRCLPVREAVSSEAKQMPVQPVLASRCSILADSAVEEVQVAVSAPHLGLPVHPRMVVVVPTLRGSCCPSRPPMYM
jgi:hypothetical protein